jgi:Kdo2-lipid IVA lauroyltransferase/acyltransferase
VQKTPWPKALRRTLRYGLVRLILAVVGRVPLATAVRWGERLGEGAFRWAPREREKALASLTVAFPELDARAREALGLASFRHLGRCAAELACLRQVDARLDTYVEFGPEDRARVSEALARGKGLVFVSGHVGHWELLARRVARDGFPCQSIAKEASDPRTSALVESMRSRGQVKTIWRGQPGAARQMLRALRGGEILGLVIDQDTRVQSVFVPFFGVPASTPRAAADLALRTGAPVLAGFCQRQADGHYRIRVREVPLPPADPDDKDSAAIALTAAITRDIEDAIRLHPEQWVWVHQRWKTRPEPAL